jgi:hypothetical protein
MWVRVNHNVGVAFSFNEDHPEGVERGSNVLVAGGHDVVWFSRKNIGERSGSIGGHNESCRGTVALTMQLRNRGPKDNSKTEPTSGQSPGCARGMLRG